MVIYLCTNATGICRENSKSHCRKLFVGQYTLLPGATCTLRQITLCALSSCSEMLLLLQGKIVQIFLCACSHELCGFSPVCKLHTYQQLTIDCLCFLLHLEGGLVHLIQCIAIDLFVFYLYRCCSFHLMLWTANNKWMGWQGEEIRAGSLMYCASNLY